MFNSRNLNVAILNYNDNSVTTDLSLVLRSMYDSKIMLGYFADRLFNTYLVPQMTLNVGCKHLTVMTGFCYDLDSYVDIVYSVLRSDLVIYVIYVHSSEFSYGEAIVDDLVLLKIFGVKQLMVVIDFLSDVDPKNSVFAEISTFIVTESKRIGFCPVRLEFVPTSILENINILLFDKGFECLPNKSVCDVIQSFEPVHNFNDRNLRLFWDGREKKSKILYGSIDEDVIELFTIENKFFLTILRTKDENIFAGDFGIDHSLLFVPQRDTDTLKLSFELEIEFYILPDKFLSLEEGQSYELLYLRRQRPFRIRKILQKFCSITNKPINTMKNQLSSGEYGRVIVDLSSGIYVELYSEYPLLGVVFVTMSPNNIIGFVRSRVLSNDFDMDKKLYEQHARPKLLKQIENRTETQLSFVSFSESEPALKFIERKFRRHEFLLNVKDNLREQMYSSESRYPLSNKLTVFCSKCFHEDWSSTGSYRRHKVTRQNVVTSNIINQMTYVIQSFDTSVGYSSLTHALFSLGQSFFRSSESMNMKYLREIESVENHKKIIEIFQILYRDGPDKFRFETIEHLAQKAIAAKSKPIMTCLIKHFAYVRMKSSSPNKYLAFVKSLSLRGHMNEIEKYAEMNGSSFEDKKNFLNYFLMAVLYYDASASFVSNYSFEYFYQLLRNNLFSAEIVNCIANFIEANNVRNMSPNCPFISSEKYDLLKVKVCTNSKCSLTLLDIFKERCTLTMATKCLLHLDLVRDLSISDIEKIIGNRSIAAYVYYFYKLFKIAIQFFKHCSHNPHLLSDLVTFITQETLIEMAFFDFDEDEFFII